MENLVDGKAIEHWSFVEVAEMMKMMTSMQGQPPMPMHGDSTSRDTMK